MKKFLLSTIVITSFVAYSIIARIAKIDQVVPIIHAKTEKTHLHIIPSDLRTTPSSAMSPTTSITSNKSRYKDGTYTGIAADAFYGNIQVAAIISGGRITAVNFLQAPSDQQNSIFINSQADPILSQEAIQAQSVNVDIVSGATDSSEAFIQSLQSALSQAQ